MLENHFGEPPEKGGSGRFRAEIKKSGLVGICRGLPEPVGTFWKKIVLFTKKLKAIELYRKKSAKWKMFLKKFWL